VSRYLKDLAERLAATGAVTGLGTWLADEWLIRVRQAQGIRLVLLFLALTLAKGIIARVVGEHDSASLVPLDRPADRGPDIHPPAPDRDTGYDY
jgi:hypothetical protein